MIEADEGEGESGDVAARAPPPQQQQPHNPSNAPVITPNSAPRNVYSQRSQSQSSATSNGNANNSYAAPNNNGYNNAINTHNNTTNNSSYINTFTVNYTSNNNGAPKGNNLRQSTLDAFPKQHRSNASISQATLLTGKGGTVGQSSSINPYQRNSTGRVGEGGGMAQVNTQSMNGRQNSLQPTNSSGGMNQMNQSTSQPNNNHIAQLQQQPRQQPVARSNAPNPYASLRPPSILANPSSNMEIDLTESPINTSNNNPPSSSQESSSRAACPSIQSQSSTSSNNTSLSFTEMKALLQSLRSNRALYEQNYGKTFIVPCKIKKDGTDRIFNIVKVDKKKKKGDKVSLLVTGFYLSLTASNTEQCSR